MTPLISIVLSNHNGSPLLKQTIDSIVSQTYKKWELIIYDDCSTDDSKDIIESFHDERIKPYFADHHEHMVYGFNYGITHSSGDFIARIDSDDVWVSNKLEKQLDVFQEHPEFGAVFSLVTMIDENNKVLTEKDTERVRWFEVRNMSQAEWLRYFYFKGSCLCHTTAMIPRRILDIVGLYDMSLIQIQDYELWTRIAKKYPIHLIQERLTKYRWMSDGSNASSPTRNIMRRSNFEFSYVLGNYFNDISDELFIEAFSGDFINPKAATKEELSCEKMLLLQKTVFCGNVTKVQATHRLMEIIADPSSYTVLKNQYGIDQLLLYELTSQPLLFEAESMPVQNPLPPIPAISAPKKNNNFIMWLKRRLG